ncbi:5-formyltetrahydrofolate cyclo-ligase [Trichonephila inaurata madagascariensis]|uniref:5-formyltetrahydrofolate cyclo-ligase n=1 Tax=Trichonephila inaurata madagascariensis TaxID=2747483 RepID=A0A8X6K7I7_9ARAC|nr:5-formyltetrahydrofolate cyclo-ligase [Trichonephila inaurata madagascariensis]
MSGVATGALRAAKAALRGELRKRIASIPHEELSRQSKLVTEKVLEHSRFKSSRRVSLYLSINEEIRVQTWGILEQMLEQDKECFVPKFYPNSHQMTMLKVYSLEDYAKLVADDWTVKPPCDEDLQREDAATTEDYAKLVADDWTVKPPCDEDLQREDAATTGGLDLMIVPGLGFTKRGHRLGGGKGYYDAYIQNCSLDPHGRPYTISLAFKEQILHSIPCDVHDFMVDEVIYPNE